MWNDTIRMCFYVEYMKTQTHTYPNGFRTVYEQSNAPVTHIHAFCEFGSAYESEGIRGIAHFIEHMCFKGTTHIHNSTKLTFEYDKIGAYMNAFTEKEFTCYVVKCDSDYTENMIHLVSDMMLNSRFKMSDCVKEEQIVIEENSKGNDDTYENLLDTLNRHLFAGSSFEFPIDTLEYHKHKMVCAQSQRLYNKYYKPSRMVLSVVSNLPYSHMRKIVDTSYFVRRKENVEIPPLKLCVSPQTEPIFHLTRTPGRNTTYIAIGFRIDATTDRHVAFMLQKVLGGPTNSRLFKTLREQNGLTYASGALVSTYANLGSIVISAETDSSRLLKNGSKKGVLPVIFEILSDLFHNGVPNCELQLVKRFLSGSLTTGLEYGELKCRSNGIAMVLYPDEPVCPLSKVYDTYYKDITSAQLHAFTRKYFVPSNMTVCIASDKPHSMTDIRKVSIL